MHRTFDTFTYKGAKTVIYMNEYLVNKNADYIEELSKRPEMLAWRHEIKNDANKFYEFCVHFDLIPNIFVLHEWWNWQTPGKSGIS